MIEKWNRQRRQTAQTESARQIKAPHNRTFHMYVEKERRPYVWQH